MTWHSKARCLDTTLKVDWLARPLIEQLLDCAICPVRQQCLDDAIASRATGVVRAGVTIGTRPIAANA